MLSIDPGKNGGIAYANYSDGTVEAVSMPKTDEKIIDLFKRLQTETLQIVHLESLVKYTGVKMPGSSMAVYAGNEGFVRGVTKALGFTVKQVQPKAWQAHHAMKREKKESKTAWKNRLKTLAQTLFPQLKVTLATADALLILNAATAGAI